MSPLVMMPFYRESYSACALTYSGTSLLWTSIPFPYANPDVRDIIWKPDGTVLYVVNSGLQDRMIQFPASTPFDITSLGANTGTFNLNPPQNGPTEAIFRSDGTKMLLIGATQDAVDAFSLGVAWDITTLTHLPFETLNVAGFDDTMRGMELTPDGTKLYMVGDLNTTITQHTLSAAWNPSTAGPVVASINVTALGALPSGLKWSPDGTKLFYSESNSRTTYEFSVSTAYDISTAGAPVCSLTVGPPDFPDPSQYRGGTWAANGAKFQALAHENTAADTVREYVL